jgi:putative hydrolase of the HAD superfamily
MKALLLDLDNTLIDRDAALVEWLRSALPAPSSRDLEALIACDGGGHACRITFYAAVARVCGTSPAQARNRFLKELPELVRLKRDADTLLRTFPGRTVVVTNGARSVQRRKLTSAGLDGRVSHVLVSDECGMRKPAVGMFQRALALAGCAPNEALMVGDHPERDIAGAQATGIDGVLVRTRWFDAPAGMKQVRSLSEVVW